LNLYGFREFESPPLRHTHFLGPISANGGKHTREIEPISFLSKAGDFFAAAERVFEREGRLPSLPWTRDVAQKAIGAVELCLQAAGQAAPSPAAKLVFVWDGPPAKNLNFRL
jgi:hypothetical protein